MSQIVATAFLLFLGLAGIFAGAGLILAMEPTASILERRQTHTVGFVLVGAGAILLGLGLWCLA